MADPSSTTVRSYVFTVKAVRRAIDKLVATPSHEHLPGYLAILQAEHRNAGTPAKLTDIVGFHDRYLKVEGAPETPYLRPFTSRGRGDVLMNSNVAGSYAPSSLRPIGRFPEVVKVIGEGRDATYLLRSDHATLALTRLLKGHKVPAASLSVFLLRDYGFKLEKPEFAKVMALFREEFGLGRSVLAEKQVFDTLFEDDTSQYSDADLELMSS